MEHHIAVTSELRRDDFRRWYSAYSWDGHTFPSREQAIAHGRTLGRGDDFNTAVVVDGRLVWFGWMRRRLDNIGRGNLDTISRHIGLTAGTQVAA